MAITLITEPNNTIPATIDWQLLISKTTKVMGECAKFRLTNMTADTEPQIESGSRFEINGSYYECSSAENITGWSSMGLNRFVYIYATPSGGSVTLSYSETAPTFDSAKGGWFNGTARALFKLFKTTATGWTAKRYVDLVEGVSGGWTEILSKNLGDNWTTALLASAGVGILAELIKVDGDGSGLDADMLEGQHAGNGFGQIPINNNIKCDGLNASMLNGTESIGFRKQPLRGMREREVQEGDLKDEFLSSMYLFPSGYYNLSGLVSISSAEYVVSRFYYDSVAQAIHIFGISINGFSFLDVNLSTGGTALWNVALSW